MNTEMKVKMILDCDTGHDDAIALMLAAAHPMIDLLGVTVVAGNHTLPHTLENTLNVCQHLNLQVPVYAGCDRPMVRRQITADDIHGRTGLDGPRFAPLIREAEKEHAVSFLIRTLMESDGGITLVPVGSLTNIAMAMRLEPRITGKIRQISMMGGAVALGNSTPAAEFNVFADPEAASVVFSSGVPITMMGLDLTNQTCADLSIISRMEKLGNKAGRLFGDIMRFTLETQRIHNGLPAGPVHDVTAVAWLVNPELFRLEPMYVTVDLTHGPCYGRTICDPFRRNQETANARVGMGIDLPAFWNMLEENLKLLD